MVTPEEVGKSAWRDATRTRRCAPGGLRRHPRTIRRDLEALEVRFPLMTERVNGQTRWRLMDGYRSVPPLASLVYGTDGPGVQS